MSARTEPSVELPGGSRYDYRHDLSPEAPEIENYAEGDGAFGYAHSLSLIHI